MKVKKIGRFKRRGIKKFLLFFSLFILLIYLVISSSYFEVRCIEISGNKNIESDELMKIVNINPRENLFKVNFKRVEDRVCKHPKIKKAKIIWGVPGKIILKIEERRPKALFLNERSLLVLDGDGMVMDSVRSFNSKLPIIMGVAIDEIKIGGKIKNHLIKKAFECINYSSKISQLRIRRVAFDSNKNIFLYTDEDLEIKLGEPKNLMNKMKYLQNILLEVKNKYRLKYIDLRCEERPAGGLRT